VLEPKGRQLNKRQVNEIPALIKKTKGKRAEDSLIKANSDYEPNKSSDDALVDDWRNELLGVLQNMDPIAFEHLCKRLLVENGFEQVSVTQRSNDRGIDGKGILRLNLISFKVLFQAKRYKSSIQGPEIRNFQAAVQGRADKGLFITTGQFTSGAKEEADRDGGTPIELIDGEILCDLLKKHSIGVETKMVESVMVDKSFFDHI
jgi:restriction system protein